MNQIDSTSTLFQAAIVRHALGRGSTLTGMVRHRALCDLSNFDPIFQFWSLSRMCGVDSWFCIFTQSKILNIVKRNDHYSSVWNCSSIPKRISPIPWQIATGWSLTPSMVIEHTHILNYSPCISPESLICVSKDTENWSNEPELWLYEHHLWDIFATKEWHLCVKPGFESLLFKERHGITWSPWFHPVFLDGLDAAHHGHTVATWPHRQLGRWVLWGQGGSSNQWFGQSVCTNLWLDSETTKFIVFVDMFLILTNIILVWIKKEL